MKELLRRLALRPRLAWEILFASFLANLMSVASSIYVILVLNRYVGYGFDGTLYSLTTGVLRRPTAITNRPKATQNGVIVLCCGSGVTA